MQDNATDHPDVITFPPLIYLAGMGLSLAAKLLWRMPITPKWLGRPRRKAGVALIAAGAGMAIWGARTFQEAGTNVSPHEPASALVEDGPYQFTRNPIYIGAAAAYSGVTLLFNNLWGFVLLPGVLAVVQRGVIEREEAYLRATFGGAYDEYTERIPRWL
ncbi:MAG TPA: isoprenylcysteine carboxylmethyltransferase family protein [Thermomicrobiales bacterium]|nr:isoprenylcysteine carboxylmethyltransferase family protein [Thermomicrobiales bacterium]